jgi:hypothetical protein
MNAGGEKFMPEKLKRVTFSIGPENYEKLKQLAAAKQISIPGFVWNLVMEAIEDDEDIREGMKALEDDKEGTITLEELQRQLETKGL